MPRRGLRWLAIAPLLLLAGAAFGQAGWPPAVSSYLDQLATVEEADPPISMEALFEAAAAAQDELMRIDVDADRAWLETLDRDAYNALSERLRGLRLSRGRDVYAQPDPLFLSELAQRLGRAEDRDFFRVYRRSWNADLIPSYLRLTSRVTPCVRFGESVIADLYAGWRGFLREHPAAYAAYARQSVRDLEEVVELGTCACGGVDSVEQELSGFVSRFPDTPARPAILARLQELEDDPDRRPVQCR